MNKTERILFILDHLSHGEKFTTSGMMEKFKREEYDITERTAQRDLKFLKKLGKLEQLDRKNKENLWLYKKEFQDVRNIHIPANELLSFHILKAHLQHFKGTVIEESIKELFDKLDRIIPGVVFDTDSMFWDKNFGKYDYFQDDATLRRAIDYISRKNWVEVKYYNAYRDNTSTFKCFPRTMFEYKGSIYLVVYLAQSAGYHIVLLIQNIDRLEELQGRKLEELQRTNIPEFNFKDWSKERFGVFWGEQKKIKLQIKKDYKRYFENRFWHESQNFTNKRNGGILLEMTVPIVPDLISWIVGWGGGITVIEPQELIDRVVEQHMEALKVYE